MLRDTVLIQVQVEATRRQEKATEGYGTEWKHMESYGSLWKTREQSIGNLVSDRAKWPGVTDGNRSRRQNRKERIK